VVLSHTDQSVILQIKHAVSKAKCLSAGLQTNGFAWTAGSSVGSEPAELLVLGIREDDGIVDAKKGRTHRRAREILQRALNPGVAMSTAFPPGV
jgi:hypothetical protein